MRRVVAATIASAPAWFLSEARSGAADFVEGLARDCPIEQENNFRSLWNRTWDGIDQEEQIQIDDALTRALNHPAGKLAEAALSRAGKYELEANAGFPDSVRDYFDAIAQDASGRLGRIMLATRLHYLFFVDPDWTTRRLLPHFRLAGSLEAKDMWAAFAWSPTAGPNLLAALKDEFLQVLQLYDSLGRAEANLIGLFLSVCLDAPGRLTDKEIQNVMEKLPEKALIAILEKLSDRLSGTSKDRTTAWRKKLHPWLEEFWPQSGARNTCDTSEAMLRMLGQTGDAFPEAVAWAIDNIQPLKERGLHELETNDNVTKYPAVILRLLKRLVGPDLPAWEKDVLSGILNKVETILPEVTADPDFQKLRAIASG